jgi:hypothetical protein
LRPLWPNVRAVAFHLLLHENWCARRLYQSTLASPVTKLALRKASLGLIVLKGITRLHTGLLIVAKASRKLHQRVVASISFRGACQVEGNRWKCDHDRREQLHA